MSKNIGRPTNDVDEIINELKRRNSTPLYTSVAQLKEANPDLQSQIKTLENKAGNTFGMSLGKYLKQIGVLAEKPSAEKPVGESKQEKWQRIWDDTIAELKKRYEGKEPPASFTDLTNANLDLEVKKLYAISDHLFSRKVGDVLREMGLLAKNEMSDEEFEAIIEELKKRRSEQMPYSFNEVLEKNPDLDLRFFNKYTKAKFNLSGSEYLRETGILCSYEEYLATVADKHKGAWSVEDDDGLSFNSPVSDLLGLFSDESKLSKEEKEKLIARNRSALQDAVKRLVESSTIIRRLLAVNVKGQPVDSANDEELKHADSLTYEQLRDQGYLVYEIDENTLEKNKEKVHCRLFADATERAVNFTVLCDYEYWDLGDYKLRPLEIQAFLYDYFLGMEGILSTKLSYTSCSNQALTDDIGDVTIFFNERSSFVSDDEEDSAKPFPLKDYPAILKTIVNRLVNHTDIRMFLECSEDMTADSMVDAGYILLKQKLALDKESTPRTFIILTLDDSTRDLRVSFDIISKKSEELLPDGSNRIRQIVKCIKTAASMIPGMDSKGSSSEHGLNSEWSMNNLMCNLEMSEKTLTEIIPEKDRKSVKPRFFTDIDTLNEILDLELTQEEFESNDIQEIHVDITEIPYFLWLVKNDDGKELIAYERSTFHVSYDTPGMEKGRLTIKEGEEPKGTASEASIGENIGAFYKACMLISKHFKNCALRNELDFLDFDKEGIVLSVSDDAIQFKLVSGKERPDLMCTSLFQPPTMMRPYMEDISGPTMYELAGENAILPMAESGDESAMLRLAELYAKGDVHTDVNPEKAVYWNERLAEIDNATAQFNLGLFYAKGFGVERDLEKAVYWMNKAAENGDEDAPETGKRFEEAAKAMKDAKEGDVQAQADLAGFLMYMGNSVDEADKEADYKESIEWAQKAADKGNADGMWTLALAYEHGRGIKQDKKKAIELYKKGAELGHAKSMNSIGAYYLRGELTDKSKEEAFEIVKKAAELGDIDAMKNLGLCYQFENGTEYDMKKAVYWYERYLEHRKDEELAQKVAVFKMLPDVEDEEDERSNETDSSCEEPSKAEKPVNNETIENSKSKGGNTMYPSYKENTRIELETISIAIPDGFEYVTRDHIPAGDDEAKELLSEYLLVMAPNDSNGLSLFRDAALGINMTKSKKTTVTPSMWKTLNSDVKKTISVNALGRNIELELVKQGDNYMVAYGQGNECSSDDEPYWIIYFVTIVHGKKEYTFNLYFNGEKERTEYYLEIVKEFSSRIVVNEDAAVTDSSAGGKKQDVTSLSQEELASYDEHLRFELPEGYEIERGIDDDGDPTYNIYYGVTIDDDGDKKAEKTFRVIQPNNEEGVSFEGDIDSDFNIKVIGNLQEVNYLFITVKAVSGSAVVEHNGNCYAILLVKVCRDEDLEEKAEELAADLTEMVNYMVIDGDRANAEPIPSSLILNQEKFDEFRKADPSENQHTHWDFLSGTKNALGFLGAFNVNQNGTEYAFIPVSQLDLADSIKGILSKYTDTGFTLADTAHAMARLFRVRYESFNMMHDREQEIEQGYIEKVSYYEAFRSFAWTLSAYCSDHKVSPSEIDYEVLCKMCRFIESRKGLNYSDKDYSPAICSGDDIHLYYLPDSVSAEDHRVLLRRFNESEKDKNRKTIVSLDALRNELTFMYPAIETIYNNLLAERNDEEALEGGAADILYAWCSMAYAAREPIFSEDGPMNCFFNHPEEQDRWEAEYRRMREERERAHEEEWLGKYGKYLSKNTPILFRGKKFVFDGAVTGDKWVELIQKLTAKGALQRNSVSGQTDYLICEPKKAGYSKINAVLEQRAKGKCRDTKIILASEFYKTLGMDNVEDTETLATDTENTVNQEKTVIPNKATGKADAAPVPSVKPIIPPRKTEKELKQERAETALSNAESLVSGYKQKYKDLIDEWQNRFNEISNEVASKDYMSEYEVTRDMKSIVMKRDRFGTKFDDLIRDLDSDGERIIKAGGDYRSVQVIMNMMDEIEEKSSALNISFSLTGNASDDIGDANFKVSYASKKTVDSWHAKFQNMPEFKAVTEKGQLETDIEGLNKKIKAAENSVASYNSEEAKLNRDIETAQAKANDLEKSFETDKKTIGDKAEAEIQDQKKNIEDAIKEKEKAEQQIKDLSTQLSGLSFFKISLKKELNAKIDSLRAQIPTLTANINEQEARLDKIKKDRDSAISERKKKKEAAQMELRTLKMKLEELPSKKKKDEAELEDLKRKVAEKESSLKEIIDKYGEEFFRNMPQNVIASANKSRAEKERDKRKEEVLSALAECDSPVTVDELLALTDLGNTMTAQRVSALLRLLMNEGVVEKTIEQGKSKYYLC